MTVYRAGVDHVARIAPLFDAYRQFYGLAPDPTRAREFIAERLARKESVIFLAIDSDSQLAVRPVPSDSWIGNML